MPPGGTRMKDQIRQKEEAQERFLQFFESGMALRDALEAAGRSYRAFVVWCSNEPKFKERYQAVKLQKRMVKGEDTDYADDFAGFRKLWFKHDSPWFHMRAIRALEEAEQGSVTMVLFPPEHGKLLKLDEPLPTPSGWTTMGEVQRGDEVFGRSGVPIRVIYKSETQTVPAFRLHFSDGSHIDACADHQWFVRCRDNDRRIGGRRVRNFTEVLRTSDMVKRVERYGRLNLAIPVHDAFDLPEADLLLDPYVLGMWLGDGTTAAGQITTSHDDRPTLEANMALAGWDRYSERRSGGGAPSLYFYGLSTALRGVGVLGNKHIPSSYLRASEKQRMALLQGLMDSDGSCSKKGQCEFSSIKPRLAEDAEELIRSLGFKVRRCVTRAQLNSVDHGEVYRLWFYPRSDRPVFRLERKAERQLPSTTTGDRDRWQIVQSIEPIKPITGACIQVDAPDGLYVAGRSQIVTHNTTLMEDYICWKLATEPELRIMVGSEKLMHGKKVVGRVKNRMEPQGPFPGYVHKFGPFAPQQGDDGYQPWGSEYMNVRFKGNHDERDYSLAALGFGATIIGTRTDILFVDDPQSTKTIGQTEQMVETFRQDWLTRPGVYGKTIVWGSRVGEDDFYQALIDAEIIDRLIMFPAVDMDGKWLWPERYSAEQYQRLRRNAGEPAWQRNYMMRPQAAGESKFSQEMLDLHADPMRAVFSHPPLETCELAVGVDPGFGTNATMVAAFCPGKMVVLDGRTDHNLRNNQEIVAIIGEQCEKHRLPDKIVSQVIIEDKAFQKGLIMDESLIRLRDRYGFDITGHNTGQTKNDEDFGVASMAAGFLRGEIVLPGSDDPHTKAFRDALDAELKSWRPRKRGTQLRQDMVMSLWFLWLLWRRRRDAITVGPSEWSTRTVPWPPTTKPRLIVPAGNGGWR